MLNKSKTLFASLMALIVTGCTQVGLGVANIPIKFSDAEIQKNIAYGDQPWQKLDLYIPTETQNQKLPMLVFFYGGRWTEGSKDMYKFVGDAYTKEGYIVAIADYSKYPKVKFPKFVEDGAKAVAWVYRNADQFNGDPDNLFIMGHSSGGHIGALVAADGKYLQAEGLDNDIITAFAGLAGPYDFIPEAEDLKDIFGPPENYPLMQVPTYIDGDEAPMLLIWGDEDQAVWRRNLDRLEAKINDKGGMVETKIYEGVNHVGTIASLTWFLRSKAPVLKHTTEFFEKHKNK
jgi:acetyl esterase/lipase